MFGRGQMTSFFTDQRFAIPIAIGILLVGFLAARQISALARWRPAGPIALLAATPLIPNIRLGLHLSADDLLPLIGLGILIWQGPLPSWTRSRLFGVALIAVLVATVARVASAIANGTDVADSFAMLVEAVVRPVLLVAIAAYVATAQPAERRRSVVAAAVATVGTFVAAFGLIAYTFPLPDHIGIQLIAAWKESLGGCGARITGTLGLGANHVGAVFLLTIPVTMGLAIRQQGWPRWMWAVATAVQGVALILTFTRTSIILAAFVLVALLVYHRQLKLLLVTFALGAGLLLLVMSVACQPKQGGKPAEGGQGPIAAITNRFGDTTDRPALWYSATVIMLDHPVFGVGLGRIQEVIASNPDRYVHTPFGTAASTAHNTILLAGAETGVLGALATMVLNAVLALAALVWIWRGRHNPLLSAAGFAVGAFLIQGMLNNLFTVGVTGVLLALLVGTFASVLSEQSNRIPPTTTGVAES
jgi:O-antigen ligase